MMIQEEVGSSKQWSSMDTQSSSIYSALRSSTLHEIKNIALDGSYSSKIDMSKSSLPAWQLWFSLRLNLGNDL